MSSTEPERPMILGNCISCNGLMRVPVTTDVSHVACCPHCNERFPVQQMIASAIPAAEIIQGETAEDFTPAVDRVREPVDEDVVKPRVKFEVPKQIYNGAKHRRGRRRRRSRESDERKEQAAKQIERSKPARPKMKVGSVPVASPQPSAEAVSADVKIAAESPRESLSTRSSSSSSSSDSNSGTSRSGSSKSRSRRPSTSEPEEEANTVVEWLKIGVGGFIAFPLAYFGLMWIAGLDPFGIAPTIHKVVPFVVPSRFIDEDVLPEFDDLDAELDDGLSVPSTAP